MATVRALHTFAAFTPHGVIGVAKDQPFEHDDPMVKAYPDKFAPDNADAPKKRSRAGRVEQATANPGEYRDL